MPRIIERPTVARTTTRGLSESDTQEYLDMMVEAEDTGQMVEVDDSDRDTREKAYVRGERVRIAANKYKIMPEGKTIGIVAYKADETEEGDVWRAGVYLKDAPKVTTASSNGKADTDEK